MPLPLILGGIAAVAAVGSGIQGGKKMKDADETMKLAKQRYETAKEKVEKAEEKSKNEIESIGKLKVSIGEDFKEFADVMETIKKTKFNPIENDTGLPEVNLGELREISMEIEVIKSAIESVGSVILVELGLGTIAAKEIAKKVSAFSAGMTVEAVSIGTMASLSGAAIANTTLTALGGGALAVGGGLTLETLALSGPTFGLSLLVGGVVFNVSGSKMSEKADKAYCEAKEIEKKADEAVEYLNKLYKTAKILEDSFINIRTEYKKRIKILKEIVYEQGKNEWNEFNEEEKLITNNLVSLVQLLFNMCKIKLILNENKEINTQEVEKFAKNANEMLTNNNKDYNL